jgi:hypothetical protein
MRTFATSAVLVLLACAAFVLPGGSRKQDPPSPASDPRTPAEAIASPRGAARIVEPPAAPSLPNSPTPPRPLAPLAIPETKGPEIPVPSSPIELEILKLGRGLAGSDLLRARVAFKEATVETLSADSRYNPWKAELDKSSREQARLLLEATQKKLVDLRYQRLEHERALRSAMLATGQFEIAGTGDSDQPRTPDETVWNGSTPEGQDILLRIRTGMSSDADRVAFAESLLMAQAERDIIALFRAAHVRELRR